MKGASKQQLELLSIISQQSHTQVNRPDAGLVLEMLEQGVDPNFGTAAPQSSPMGAALNVAMYSPIAYGMRVIEPLLEFGANPLLFDKPFNRDFIAIREKVALHIMTYANALETQGKVFLRGEKGETLAHVLACQRPKQMSLWMGMVKQAGWMTQTDANGNTPIMACVSEGIEGLRNVRHNEVAATYRTIQLSEIMEIASLMLNQGIPLATANHAGHTFLDLMAKYQETGRMKLPAGRWEAELARIQQEQMEAQTKSPLAPKKSGHRL